MKRQYKEQSKCVQTVFSIYITEQVYEARSVMLAIVYGRRWFCRKCDFWSISPRFLSAARETFSVA